METSKSLDKKKNKSKNFLYAGLKRGFRREAFARKIKRLVELRLPNSSRACGEENQAVNWASFTKGVTRDLRDKNQVIN